MIFERTNEDARSLEDATRELLTKVKDQLKKYTPWDLLSAVHKLHPSQFPASIEALGIQYPVQRYPGDSEAIRIYAEKEVTKLATNIGLNLKHLPAWEHLVKSIVSQSS